MSKLILRIDASAFKESGCMRRFYWSVVSGYRYKLNTNDIEFGSAFHEFIKTMKENPGRYDLATRAAQARYSVPMEMKSNKGYMTQNYLTNTCISFWQQWVEKDQFETLVQDGKPLVECKFLYPYYADDQVEVALCGTIDDICKHKHGTFAIRDYKTTSSGKKEEYLDGYTLSPQLLFYRMIIDYYARTYPHSIFGQFSRQDIACFIDAIFLQGASKAPEFKRSEVYVFRREQMAEFEKLVHKKVMELVEYVHQNVLPDRDGMLNGSCQTVYGQCKFFGVCKQTDEIGRNHMLNRHFIQREYNPLRFGEEHNEKPTNMA